ncbi:putative P-type H(+)-exporting transporter [Helianthus anomalus]
MYLDSQCIESTQRRCPQQILNLAHTKSDIEHRVYAAINKFADLGLRLLVVVYQGQKESPAGSWQFIGLMPLFDPPRHVSVKTIQRALNLGVNIKMITGAL